ncbi:MAG TPA: hypothetical protein VKP30_21955, partial [Polyangiaceae bacterium]|nr:hypothetical protein [Polyangiaceae bacterium]
MVIDTRTIRSAVPRHVIELCEQLAQHGHRGWVVGGSVRDALLNDLGCARSRPADWDVATSA